MSLPQGSWHVRLRDLDTGRILREADLPAGHIHSAERYYLRGCIEVWVGGRSGEPVFRHDYSGEGRDVLVQFPAGTLGDTLGWFPYAVKFQARHRCRLSCAMPQRFIPLFRESYPHIRFLTHEQIEPSQYYATYRIGLLLDDAERIHQPCDWRWVGLHRIAGYILGVDPTEVPARIAVRGERPPMSGPYACVGGESALRTQQWTQRCTWREIVRCLLGCGYRVVCLDPAPLRGSGFPWQEIPGVEGFTGERTLLAYALWLKHAELIVSRSSGLSRLAQALGTPVVMIGGERDSSGRSECGRATTVEALKDAIRRVAAAAQWPLSPDGRSCG